MEFKEWITKRYVEWRGDAIGNERSIRDYAKHLNVSQSIATQWMQGNRKPSTRTLPKLASKYPDVYDVLGLPRPASTYDLSNVDPGIRDRMKAAIEEYNQAAAEKGIKGDSEEGKALFAKVFKKYGFGVEG